MTWELVINYLSTPIAGLVIFVVIQLINVIFSTIKSVATVKSDPTTAARINGISYTISNILTKFLVGQTFATVIISTYLTNRVGVQIGRYITDKRQPEKLWVYKCHFKMAEDEIINLKQLFKDSNIDCIYKELSYNERYLLEVYAYTKEDSSKTKNILGNYSCYCHIEEPVEWCKFN